jgi:hypothetical protein
VGIEQVQVCTKRTLCQVQGEEYQRKIFTELLNTQEEDLCKECTRPTLRQNVERSRLKAQSSARSAQRRTCSSSKAQESVEFPRGHQKSPLKEAEGSRPFRVLSQFEAQKR